MIDQFLEQISKKHDIKNLHKAFGDFIAVKD